MSAQDYFEGQVGKACVDQRPAQRLQPGSSAIALADHAERGFAEPPHRITRESEAEKPQRDQAIRLPGEQLQSALLVSLVGTAAESDEDRDPPNEDVDRCV